MLQFLQGQVNIGVQIFDSLLSYLQQKIRPFISSKTSFGFRLHCCPW